MQNVPNIVRERLKAASRAADLSHAQAHPDANLLTAFAEQSLAESERGVVLDHLSRCGDCRDIVALALPATEPVEAAIKKPATSWLTWPALRWGFVTGGILAIAALGIVRYQRRTENTASKSPVQLEIAKKEATNQPLASPVPAAATKKADNLPPPVAPALADSLNATHVTANGTTRVPRAEIPAPMVSDRSSGPPAMGGSLPHGPRMANQWQQQVVVQNQAPTAASPFAKHQAARALAADTQAPAVSETVEVQAQAAQMDSQSQNLVMLPIESGKSKDQPLAPSAVSEDNDEARVGKAKPAEPASPATGGVVAYAVKAPTSSPANGTSVAASLAPRWSISSAGSLQRSFNRGTTWQVVDVNASPVDLASATSIQIVGKTSRVRKVRSPVFRAVAATGIDVWAGGSEGALYHSRDAGDHWIRVMPTSSGAVLTGDIVSLEFADMGHGKVSTSTAEVWTTSDAGQTWQRQ